MFIYLCFPSTPSFVMFVVCANFLSVYSYYLLPFTSIFFYLLPFIFIRFSSVHFYLLPFIFFYFYLLPFTSIHFFWASSLSHFFSSFWVRVSGPRRLVSTYEPGSEIDSCIEFANVETSTDVIDEQDYSA